MSNLVDSLERKQLEVFRLVHGVLTRNGHACRLVGGAVRDLLSGRTPKDVDVATDAVPERVSSLLSGYYYRDSHVRVIPTGAKHGTVTAVVKSFPIEITTLRVDVETDGRHAEVEFTDDWKLDAARRDFTFNAMSMDLDGTLHDYFGGRADLDAGIVRFVGDPRERIREDYLRILRFFRFYSRLDNPGPIDDHLLSVLEDEVIGLRSISGERIWSELVKILEGPSWEKALDAMFLVGVHSEVGLSPAQWISGQPAPMHVLADMLEDVQQLDELRARLKFDTSSYRLLSFLIQHRDEPPETLDEARDMIVMGESQSDVVHLLRYVGLDEVADGIKELVIPKFPVSGNDVREAGVPPGPSIGTWLKVLRLHWTKSNCEATREELLAHIHEVKEGLK